MSSISYFNPQISEALEKALAEHVHSDAQSHVRGLMNEVMAHSAEATPEHIASTIKDLHGLTKNELLALDSQTLFTVHHESIPLLASSAKQLPGTMAERAAPSSSIPLLGRNKIVVSVKGLTNDAREALRHHLKAEFPNKLFSGKLVPLADGTPAANWIVDGAKLEKVQEALARLPGAEAHIAGANPSAVMRAATAPVITPVTAAAEKAENIIAENAVVKESLLQRVKNGVNSVRQNVQSFLSKMQDKADGSLKQARGPDYKAPPISVPGTAVKSTGEGAGAWFKNKVLGWRKPVTEAAETIAERPAVTKSRWQSAKDKVSGWWERHSTAAEKNAAQIAEHYPGIGNPGLRGVNPGGEPLMRSLSAAERAEPSLLGRLGSGIAEHGGTAFKGASRFGGNLVLASVAGAGLLTLGALLSAPKPSIARMPKFDDEDALAFSGGNSTVDVGGIAMPALGQQQSGWMSRVPSLEDQLAQSSMNGLSRER